MIRKDNPYVGRSWFERGVGGGGFFGVLKGVRRKAVPLQKLSFKVKVYKMAGCNALAIKEGMTNQFDPSAVVVSWSDGLEVILLEV